MKKIFILLFLLANYATTFAQNAPTDFLNTYQGARRMDWSWTDNATDEDGYYMMRKLPADASFATIATLPANSTTFMDCGVSPATAYQYKVVAYKGGSTGESYVYNISTKAAASGEPVAPSNLSLTMTGFNSLTLNWSDNSSNETAFYIYSKAPDAANFSFLTTAAANAFTANANIAPPNALFRYKITAVNASGESCFSNEVVVTPFVAPAPNAPSNLIVTSVVGKTVSLKWNDNSTNETNFTLERSVDNNSYFDIGGFLPPNTTTFISNEDYSILYYYRVKACNAGSCSAYSNIVTANTGSITPPPPTPCTAPNAPSNLVATTLSNKAIGLSWNDNSTNETNFLVERSVDNNFFWQIDNLPANFTSTTSTELYSGYKYFYRVRACNGGCCSAYSNTANATTLSFPLYVPPGGRIGLDDPQSILPNQPENTSLRVFPNPANELIQIQLPDNFKNQNVNLNLVNLAGQKVWDNNIQNYSGETIEVSTTNYQNGLYLLTAKANENNSSKKISIQH